MANRIKIRSGTTTPGTGDLEIGELGLRTDTGQLFAKTDGSTVVEIGDTAGFLPLTGGTIEATSGHTQIILQKLAFGNQATVSMQNEVGVLRNVFGSAGGTDDDFFIGCYDNAGAWVGSALYVDGVTQAITLGFAVTASSSIAATGAVTGSNLNVSNWDTAFGWGDHSGVYLPIAGTAANSSLVNSLTVETAVPTSALFTDTVYTHPTTAGNKHIPTAGSVGQVLKNTASGTATWQNETDTVYTHPTTAGNKHIPTGGTVGQILKNTASGTATWQAEGGYTHPSHPGDDFSVDSTLLAGATIISDIDINVTTDALGHVTDANGTIATRELTLADIGYTGDANANNYTHPTTAGNKHLPTGGTIGYVLTNTASGDGTWQASSSPTNYVTNDASDTMSGSLTLTGNLEGDATGGEFAIINRSHGDWTVIQGENASGVLKDMFAADPDAGTFLSFAGSTILSTEIGGIAVDSGASNVVLNFYVSAVWKGYIEHTGTDFELKNTTNSGWVNLTARNVSAATNTLFAGDPDGLCELYFNGEKTFETRLDGINALDSGGFPTIGFMNGSTQYGIVYGWSGALSVESSVWGNPIEMSAYNASGTWKRQYLGDPDTGVGLYYTGSKAFETTADGIDVYDTSGSVPIIALRSSSSTLYGQILGDGSFMYLRAPAFDGIKLQVNAVENAVVCNSNGSTDLFYNNILAITTESSGLSIADTSGNDPLLQFYEDDLSTRSGYIQFHSTLGVIIEGEKDGVGVNLRGNKVSGGAEASLMFGDPDNYAYLYYAGVAVARTLTKANGGMEVYNTATGAGWERVLTTADLV